MIPAPTRRPDRRIGSTHGAAGLVLALTRTGDPDDDRCAQRAGLLATSAIGANLVSKVTGDAVEIGRLVDALADEVRRWRDA